jgi:hypothetical protein
MHLIFQFPFLAVLLATACAQGDILSSLLGGGVSSVLAPVTSARSAASSALGSAASSRIASIAPLPTVPQLLSSLVALQSSIAGSASSGALRPSWPSTLVTSTPVISGSAGTSDESSETSSATGIPSEPHGSSLSTGAKAGIGIAIPVVLLLLAGLAFLLWRRKKAASAPVQTAPIDEYPAPKTAYSGLMVQAYEDNHDPTKPELDSRETAVSSPPPMYAHHQSSKTYQPNTYQSNAHELAISDSSPPMQPSELNSTQNVYPSIGQTVPADVGPAIVIPAPYREEENRIEQLRAQRAAVARDRERKEEIDRMRAEEERLDKAIAELESRRY